MAQQMKVISNVEAKMLCFGVLLQDSFQFVSV